MTNTTKKNIWNRNFTILTLGSAVSMTGANLTSYASSLFVLDKTSSTFLFALFSVLAILPGIILPVTYPLDKFSRRKTIYTLDFITAGIYAFYAAMYFTGHLGYCIIAAGNILLGSISCIYSVAYQSFYPLIVEKQNLSKAYAVTSTIESVVPFVTPLSFILYRSVGLGFLYAINFGCYITAAVFELFIRQEETFMKHEDEVFGIREYTKTFRDGLSYLSAEKGLLAIVLYFTFTSFFSSSLDVNILPYFKENLRNGEVLYMYVWGCFGLGRIAGGRLHYRYRLPANKKFIIAISVYCITSAIDGTLLFMPLKCMYIFYFISGVLSMTSYNIRIASTQNYVPDDRKGRYNGTFNMLCSLGAILGRLTSGAASDFADIRTVIFVFMMCNMLCSLIIFLPGRNAVKKIYNQDI